MVGRRRKTARLILPAIAILAVLVFTWKTARDILPFPPSLDMRSMDVRKVRIVDRAGVPLSVTYANEWNIHDFVPLHEIPELLLQAFIVSEDQRYFSHGGVDWKARIHALVQNIRAGRAVRGASTVTEQVVRMLHPRPRTLWSRWIEGFEGVRLERLFTKADILEFYLNQVPYGHNRRGVAQAARLYFDRGLHTLDIREMLALAVLVRAPSSLDLHRNPAALEKGIDRLAWRMLVLGVIDETQHRMASSGGLSPARHELPVDAGHFTQHLYRRGFPDHLVQNGTLVTTLDASLQKRVRQILDGRLRDLSSSDVRDGAVLVVDHQAGEVLAWVNGWGLCSGTPGGWIDAVTAPRQPGSTLKPFLYALALDSGWTPATLIDDSPLVESLGQGLHFFRNYSRTCYGPLRLREALGNSLNIPAVRTIQFVGTDRFLSLLHELGFNSLSKSHNHYGQGLALGDGEVSLFELVRAYTALARSGELHPLRMAVYDGEAGVKPVRVFSEEAASTIADILSDPQARRLEFGDGNLLRLPVQTAVKTGTSSGHLDSWVVGFSHRHTVGVWMGNLDRRPTIGVTGASGPALVMRAVFAELNRHRDGEALFMSPRLVQVNICPLSGTPAGSSCPGVREFFKRGEEPVGVCPIHADSNTAGTPPSAQSRRVQLQQPTPGLQLAMDPRIPDDLEAFPFVISVPPEVQKVEWLVNGEVAGVTGVGENRFLWPVSRGSHLAMARVWLQGVDAPLETPRIPFAVR
ncbi:MAG: transglycosylase domain-containing protein [Syntrophobacteraceae bacterium]|nr:transglycosylase domain-containing protein [Syntrophobacteraceae bacterium]